MKRLFGCLMAASVLVGCGTPTQPGRRVVTPISGSFFERPWSHSILVPSGFDHVSVNVTFFGDYNDFLWIEIRDGEALIGQVRAQGDFDPAKRLDADVVRTKTYELRIWTDKCCTKYEALITQWR